MKNSKAPIRNYVLKIGSRNQNHLALGALSLAHTVLLGRGWDASFLGLQLGPEHPHQAPGERELRGMHWQCAGIEQVPRSSYQPDIWACPAGLGQPELLMEAGCNWGSSEGCPFFPMLLQGLPSCWPGWETQLSRCTYESYPKAQSYPFLTPQSHPPFHQQALGIYLGLFCSFSLFDTVYVIPC